MGMRDEEVRKVIEDPGVDIWTFGLFVVILYLDGLQTDVEKGVAISRRMLMKMAGIRSIATYHKCIKKLQERGYITYFPCYNPYKGSRVFVNRA